jgi:hypothetical protein
VIRGFISSADIININSKLVNHRRRRNNSNNNQSLALRAPVCNTDH